MHPDSRRILRPVSVVVATMVTSALVLGTQIGGARAGTASNKARAKKDLLVLSDLPSGWKVEHGSSGSASRNFPGAKQLAGCIGVPSKLFNSNPPEVDSPYFENKAASLEVQDSLSLFGSAKVAKAEFAAIANSKTPPCMTTIMNGAFKAKIQASAGSGANVGTITVGRADTGVFGKGTTGLVISVPITGPGQSVTVNIMSLYHIKGSLGQQIHFNAYGSPFPTSVAKALITTAASRL